MKIEAIWYDPETGEMEAFRGGSWAPVGRVNGEGYVYFCVSGKDTGAHRTAWEMAVGPIPPGKQIDHINRVKTDNRLCNLRLATISQNRANAPCGRTKSFIGVFYFKGRKRWCSQIMTGQRRKAIGYFKTPEEAARAYDAAAVETFGEFATLNFPPAGEGK